MKKILIIDDSTFMRTVLKDLLINPSSDIFLIEEVELYEADGKVHALEQFKKAKPDVILVDIVMKESETEGVEFLKEIKNEYNMQKVIIISSIGQSFILDACEQLGVTSYLQKPFEPNQVIEAINRILV